MYNISFYWPNLLFASILVLIFFSNWGKVERNKIIKIPLPKAINAQGACSWQEIISINLIFQMNLNSSSKIGARYNIEYFLKK